MSRAARCWSSCASSARARLALVVPAAAAATGARVRSRPAVGSGRSDWVVRSHGEAEGGRRRPPRARPRSRASSSSRGRLHLARQGYDVIYPRYESSAAEARARDSVVDGVARGLEQLGRARRAARPPRTLARRPARGRGGSVPQPPRGDRDVPRPDQPRLRAPDRLPEDAAEHRDLAARRPGRSRASARAARSRCSRGCARTASRWARSTAASSGRRRASSPTTSPSTAPAPERAARSGGASTGWSLRPSGA